MTGRLAALVLALFGLLQPIASNAQSSAAPLTISFADVGQGASTLIRTPEGRAILIDAGPNSAAMERLFFEFIDDTLHFVIASHNHADHIGGMPWLFERFVVRAYMDNGVPHTTGIYRRTMLAVEREPDLQYLQATERTITVGSVRLRILPPPMLDASQNNNSVGILVEYGDFRALLTGDSERRELRHWLAAGKIPRVHIVKAAHHGALNGVTTEFIRATSPTAVVVSAGAFNRYGHPSPVVIRSWEASGARVYRTDSDGSVFVVATPDGKFQVYTKANILSRRLPK